MSKKKYIKPTFVKNVVGTMNKFGNNYNCKYIDKIDNVPIDVLENNFGSPLFVFSENTLRNQYRKIYEMFSTRYPNVQFSWSYKTNYLGGICSLFHQEGEIAEVVSGFEYEKARHLGVSGEDIIFNGPYKEKEDLKRALQENAIVNLDNFEEIYRAEAIAKELNKKCKVGIRLKIEIGTSYQWNKFGFSLDDKKALEAVNRIIRSDYLEINGLHTHIGTFILEPQVYAIAAEKLVTFMNEIEENNDISIEYLDLGGGFPSKSRLKGIYQSPEVVVPKLEEYADAICNTILRHLKSKDYPKLLLETGRAMVDEAGYLISTVVGQKYLPDGTNAYFIDTGINNLYTSSWYNYNILPDRPIYSIIEPCRIYGPLCMNIDVVAENVYLPPLSNGTRLIIYPVGAYNVTQWMQFITYRPAIVMVMADGSVELLRRKEKLEDVINCESVPKSLRIG